MSNPNPLRRLPGWALLLIAVGLVLFIAVATVATWAWSSHRAGQLEWQETVAELESKGFACSPQSYLKMNQVEVDEDLLGRYQAWEARANRLKCFVDTGMPWLRGVHGSSIEQENWWGVHPPKDLGKILENGKILLDDLIHLLRTEKLQISEIPGFRRALKISETPLYGHISAIWTPDSEVILGASRMLCHKVLIDDALSALRDLDLFDRSLRQGESFRSVFGHHAIGSIRDSGWLGAMVHKRVDFALARNWLDEPDRWIGRTDMAMRFEMGVYQAALMQDIDSIQGSYTLGTIAGDRMQDILKLTFHNYVRSHHLVAKHARETCRVIDAMESGQWVIYDEKLRAEIDASKSFYSITNQITFEFYRTGWCADLHARLVRTAARIVIVHDQTGILPADESALATAGVLLRTMPMTTGRIRYERLGDHRFRVCADPAGPFPDPELGKRTAMHNDFGKPASSNLLVDKRGSIEIDIAGLREAKR